MAVASLAFSFLFILLSLSAFSEAGSITINSGKVPNDLPLPSKVVELLKSNDLTQLKLYNTDADILTALANSDIKAVVALPNELLFAMKYVFQQMH